MSLDKPPSATEEQMPLFAVSALCRRETQRFLTHQPNDPRYCFELFRRGLLHPPHADREAAWQALYAQYHLQVVRAAQKHPLLRSAGESAEAVADSAFARMWRSFANDPDKLSRFSELGGLIKFLQLCAHSVIVDACRRQVESDPIPEQVAAAPQRSASRVERAELWRAVRERINDEQEAAVVYAAFEMGLPPRTVYELYPDHFRDVREVHRVSERLLRRLRRDESLHHFLEPYR
jgi:DNA-directed RNA polymerase specialized sigma24 family protein